MTIRVGVVGGRGLSAMPGLQANPHTEVTAGVTMDELWWLVDAVETSGKVYRMAETTVISRKTS